MTTISFEDLPKAVTELNRKVDELSRVIHGGQLMQQEEVSRFLTVEEAAEFLNLTKPTIYSKVSRRELPYMKRGKRLYFSRKDIETYIQEGRVKSVRELEEDADMYLSKNRKQGRA